MNRPKKREERAQRRRSQRGEDYQSSCSCCRKMYNLGQSSGHLTESPLVLLTRRCARDRGVEPTFVPLNSRLRPGPRWEAVCNSWTERGGNFDAYPFPSLASAGCGRQAKAGRPHLAFVFCGRFATRRPASTDSQTVNARMVFGARSGNLPVSQGNPFPC